MSLTTEEFMPKVNGKSFYCDCTVFKNNDEGNYVCNCNVFRKNDKGNYVCNGCKSEYEPTPIESGQAESLP